MLMEPAAKAIIAQAKILSILIMLRMMKNFTTFIFCNFCKPYRLSFWTTWVLNMFHKKTISGKSNKFLSVLWLDEIITFYIQRTSNDIEVSYMLPAFHLLIKNIFLTSLGVTLDWSFEIVQSSQINVMCMLCNSFFALIYLCWFILLLSYYFLMSLGTRNEKCCPFTFNFFFFPLFLLHIPCPLFLFSTFPWGVFRVHSSRCWGNEKGEWVHIFFSQKIIDRV